MPEMIACNVCGEIHQGVVLEPGTKATCTRCGAVMARHVRGTLHLTAACSLGALLLYVPANIFPILKLQMHGVASENTVWEGCVLLFRDGQWGIAVIVFLASILIPLLKLMGLFYLVMATFIKARRGRLLRTWIFRLVEGIGRWAMLDVFVMAVLVSLVKLQRLATIIPGQGLAAFTAVVVLTLLASASFDSRLIWTEKESP